MLPGDEVIDSDLDDSDDELKDDGDEEEGDVDIVFCVYDKVSCAKWKIDESAHNQVQRVKNKWKTTFKDGMIHINGRDYLFAKCTGCVVARTLKSAQLTVREFEW